MKKINEQLNSVRNRLFFTISGVIIIIICVLILTNTVILESFYMYKKIYSIKKVYEDINRMYEEQVINIEEKIEKMAIKNNIDILIKKENAITIYSTERVMPFNTYKQENSKVLFDDEKMKISIEKNNELNFIVLSGKLDNRYLIYISISITAIEESVRISNNLLLIMGVIIIIASAIISFVISKKFTKPILKLNSIANKMSNLDFSEKYRISDSEDEINELGKSINTMSDKLERTIKQLRSNNNQLEKDIEEKSKIDEMRMQFISDVSHELKTPIALIQGYAEGLVENVNTDEESKKYYAEVILDESNKMDKLVRQLLELMKLEYGKREFNNNTFDIVELIKEVIRKCNMMIEEKQLNVEFKYNEPIKVYADSFYIEQAFTNYLTNAIKHCEEVKNNKKIIIKLEDEKKHIKVSVYNTGNQIPEEDINKIWGRFYKVDSSRNRDDGGSGIGLALVKAIMNSCNEEYGVENKENGVEFWFFIKKEDF